MADEEIPSMNLAALKFQARMMDAILGMKSAIKKFMEAGGQTWDDWPAADLVDKIIAEYGESEEDE